MRMYRIEEVISRIVVEGRAHTTYGIRIESDEGCAVVEDVSVDRAAVAALRRRMYEGRLSPLHLQDVVEDWLDGGLL